MIVDYSFLHLSEDVKSIECASKDEVALKESFFWRFFADQTPSDPDPPLKFENSSEIKPHKGLCDAKKSLLSFVERIPESHFKQTEKVVAPPASHLPSQG